MEMGNFIRNIFTLFLSLFYFTSASAIDRVDAALNSLRYQIQLVSLIQPSERFTEYKHILAQGTRDDQLDIVDDIQSDLAQVWLSENIPIQGGGGTKAYTEMRFQ